jgi:large subunit ribosomal protein L10
MAPQASFLIQNYFKHMAKTKAQKNEMVESYKQKLAGRSGVIIIDHKGLTAAEVNEFKKTVLAIGGSFNVVKNTLFNIALDESGLPKLDIVKSGAHAAVYMGNDVAETAKTLQTFMKSVKDKMELRTGILDGQVLSAAQLSELADLPSKEQSVAMIAGVLNQSLAGVVNVLEDSIRSVAVIINQAFKE